jgi:hypothetical protein
MCYNSNSLWLPMTPNFRREMGVGAFLFLALLALLCGSLERMVRGAISLMPDPANEGASRVLKGDVVVSALLIV